MPNNIPQFNPNYSGPVYNPNQPPPGYVYNPYNPGIVYQQAPPVSYRSAPLSPEQIRALKMQEINRLIPEHEGHGLRGLEIRPKNIRFATQNANEQVFILVRKHWITNLGWMLKNIAYCFIPFIIVFLISIIKINFRFLTHAQSFILLISFYSLIITNVIKNFLDWYFDPYIVTNDRIIHYDFKPFISYEVKEAMLEDLEDITEHSAGFIPGLFNYGDVFAATASKEGDFLFEGVPNPTRVRDILSDLSKVSKEINERFSR